MIPRIWGTARVIIDEERFSGLPEFEHTVEPRGLELLLYMVNGTTAVLHPVLQGQVGVGFVPALTGVLLSMGCHWGVLCIEIRLYFIGRCNAL